MAERQSTEGDDSGDNSRPNPESDADNEGGEDDEDDDLPALIPRGNAPRVATGLPLLLAGLLGAFFLMVIPLTSSWSIPLGGICIVIAAAGIFELFGTFDDAVVAGRRTELLSLVPAATLTFGGGIALYALLRLAVAGWLPVAASAVGITASFVTTVVGMYRFAATIGAVDASHRPLHRRHGFWLVAISAAVFLPMLGSHSLTDPWETHYGEVSREILARRDWISLWWAQDGWFWSKPIGLFWLQALSMKSLGVRTGPGEMLSAVAEGREPWPEWALRFPIFLFAVLALYLSYRAVSASHGRRAGFLGGLALLTMPQWFLVAQQTMTDMPFVAAMAASMSLFLLGIHEDPEQTVKTFRVDVGGRSFGLSAFHLLFLGILMTAIPQILYLASLNVEVTLSPLSVSGVADTFWSGSAGNCDVPGNAPCTQYSAKVPGALPVGQALVWVQALTLLLYINWGERRARRLLFIGAFWFAALATMAKGPAGFGLPVLCALLYVIATKRYRILLEMEIASGLLLLLCVALPWFVAMYTRHGQDFTNRLLFHDMFKRALTGVHDTNKGDDTSFRYYIWQLGYATFPWVGLVPLALVRWLRPSGTAASGDDGNLAGTPSSRSRRRDTHALLVIWFLFTFALFALMLTKFHHYIFPALPPLAMLVGIVASEFLGDVAWRHGVRSTIEYASCLLLGTGALIVGCFYAFNGRLGTSTPILGLGLAIFWLAHQRFSERKPAADLSPERQFDRSTIGAAALIGAALVFLVGRDLFGVRGESLSQQRLLHLFTYNYERPFPSALDFRPELFAFAGAFTLLLAFAAVARVRRLCAHGFIVGAVTFAGWATDVYFVQLSPHWGQRDTVLAYERANLQQPGPISAYQMNWKGENFYLGNRVPTFVRSGETLTNWVRAERAEGVTTFYFFSLHERVVALHHELGRPKSFTRLTTPTLNNKFVLVRTTFAPDERVPP